MSTNLQVMALPVPIGNLEAYIQQVNQIPMLSYSEEQELAIRFRDHSDIDAAKRLVLAHLRFVAKIARGYMGYGLMLGDLIQEGNIGLMKAVKRFNPELGVRLVSFAVHWIKAEIHEFIIRNWRIVKVATTKAQRKLFFNLRNTKKRLGWFTPAEIEAVATDLGVKPETVREMENRMAAYDVPFDVDANEEDDTQLSLSVAPVLYLEDNRYDPVEQLAKHDWAERNQTNLQQALANLDKRSQDILKRRWLQEPKATLQELAAQYQVSAERIRQLETNAIKKLKESLQDSNH